MGTVVLFLILCALSWDQERYQAASLWNLPPIGSSSWQKDRVAVGFCSYLPLWLPLPCQELEEGDWSMQGHVKTSVPEEVPRGLCPQHPPLLDHQSAGIPQARGLGKRQAGTCWRNPASTLRKSKAQAELAHVSCRGTRQLSMSPVQPSSH